MKTSLFSFDLPESLIAQYPTEKRGQSRLMVVDRAGGRISHHKFAELVDLIPSDALLVFNNARVRKARLFGTRTRDKGKTEFLFLEKIDEKTWKALAKPLKKLQQGDTVIFPHGRVGRIERREAEMCDISFDAPVDDFYLEKYGALPLPPYIRRPAKTIDDERYQTVYAKNSGSAAAPTAGLHFTEAIRSTLVERGIGQTEITLHVGIGTFLPLRGGNIEDHVMHEETYTVSDESAALITVALKEGRTICAVGTTTVRALEASVRAGVVVPGTRSTALFIKPGYRFQVVSMLLTNFHTPRSTLLVLVSAFAGNGNADPGSGRDLILRAYEEAKKQGYRFFSYGDAMLIR